jgi:uncharacterized protein
MIFDPIYFLFVGPALLLSFWASMKVKSNFKRYSRVSTARGFTGAEAAAEILRREGISDVKIVATRGMLSDHYNPITKTLALSEGVYGSRSVAAIGVAAHEVGHAIQHARGYAPLWLRSFLVPTAKIGSSVGYIMMFLGIIIASQGLVLLGALFFSMVFLFQVVTLPVEFNASSRAKAILVDQGLINQSEKTGINKVLNAAAMTYVAAAISTLMTLLYFLFRAGLLGGRRD